ncbi:MAG: PQQ-binding-like beta-propeller repeat protein [Nitrospiraceae bacterium]|nr:PQQ-binding-like beta-propeller repeat protein [Nitrospiraceae bacterium]
MLSNKLGSFALPLITGFLVSTLGSTAMAAERLWVYSTTGGYLDSSPAIGDVDRDGSPDIVFTSTAGPVFALDAKGHAIWRVDLEDEISISPTLADVLGDTGLEVLVLTQTGRLVCLEGLTGDVIWENTELGDVKWNSMTVVTADLDQDGTLEIVAADFAGKLVCLSNAGETVWVYEEAEGIWSAPAIGDLDGDGHVEIVVATPETPLVCLNRQGEVLWRMSETTDSWEARLKREVSAPVIWDLDRDGQAEILVGIGKALAAVDKNGKLLWSYPMANQIDSAISVADADGDGEVEIYAVDLTGKFACVTPSGQEKWSTFLGKRARRSPTIADVDGDGIAEILPAGYSETLDVFGPDGGVKERLVVNAGTNGSATIVDLLGDGGLCAVIAEASGNLVVYRWLPKRENPRLLWPEYRLAARTASQYAHTPQGVTQGTEQIDLGDYYTDAAAFRLDMANPEGKALTVRLEIVCDGKLIAQREESDSGPHITAELPYDPSVLPGARVRFTSEVREGHVSVARHAYTVDVFPFAERWKALDSMRGEFQALTSTMPEAGGMVERAYYLRSQIDALQERTKAVASASPLERRALRADLRALDQALSRPLAIARQAVKEDKALAIYAANPWAPFGGMDEVIEGRTPAAVVANEAGAVAEVEAFQGEIESTAVNVFNFGAKTLTLRVTLDNLVCQETNATKPAENVVTLREVVAVPTQRMDKSADALPRLGQGHTLVAPPWDARQLWLTIDTAQLGPGTWKGKVIFRSLDVDSQQGTADLIITVWAPKLPDEQPLWFCNWTSTNEPEGALEDLVAHGTNVFTGGVPAKASFNEEGAIVGDIDYAAHDAYMKRHAPHGLVLFHSLASLSGPAPEYSPVWQKAYNQFVRTWIKHLADLGFGYDDVALYPVDEPGLSDGRLVEAFLRSAKATHEADPNIRTYTNPVGHITMEQLKRMAPYVDIWAPLHVAGWDKGASEKLDFMHSTGAQQWNYSCAHDAKHQSPLGYYRGQAWMVWSFGHTGIGIYTYFRSGDTSWFFQTGDYDMVYNGDGVVTSKRWEAVRDGVEDYTILDALRAAADAAEANGRHPKAVQEARRVWGEQATAIGKFCNWGENETVPGKTGMPGARILADQQWKQIQATREDMAKLLALLRNSP